MTLYSHESLFETCGNIFWPFCQRRNVVASLAECCQTFFLYFTCISNFLLSFPPTSDTKIGEHARRRRFRVCWGHSEAHAYAVDAGELAFATDCYQRAPRAWAASRSQRGRGGVSVFQRLLHIVSGSWKEKRKMFREVGAAACGGNGTEPCCSTPSAQLRSADGVLHCSL